MPLAYLRLLHDPDSTGRKETTYECYCQPKFKWAPVDLCWTLEHVQRSKELPSRSGKIPETFLARIPYCRWQFRFAEISRFASGHNNSFANSDFRVAASLRGQPFWCLAPSRNPDGTRDEEPKIGTVTFHDACQNQPRYQITMLEVS
jgi:hypothetical protein